MSFRTVLRVVVVWLAATALPGVSAAASTWTEIERDFAGTVRPFLATYCVGCHGKDKPKGQLDLAQYTDSRSVVRDFRQWATVAEMITSREMPPEKAPRHPADAERAQVAGWVERLSGHEAERTAGDPGPVLPRRLSNAEYDYTVRDLLGVDLRPTREFPIDPANEAGFDNSGESLTMSPALLKKYFEAARGLADHLVLKPSGFSFAPHPVVSETDRDKYSVLRIVDFYQRQPTDLARYFLAAWRFQHRASRKLTLDQIAAETQVSPRYLATVWAALTDAEARQEVGPLGQLGTMFRALPAPAAADPTAQLPAVEAGCDRMRDFVVRMREKLAIQWRNLQLKGVGVGSQPFVLWRNRQYATHRTSCDPSALYVPDSTEQRAAAARRAEVAQALEPLLIPLRAAALASPAAYGAGTVFARLHTNFARFAPDPELAIPPGPEARARHTAALARFCQSFPDAFYVSERDRPYLDRPKDRQLKGRLLGAGYHNMMGYFRDDQPLYEMILDRQGQRELDQLWRELDFISFAPTREHADFIFYERAEGPKIIRGAEFDFARSENPETVTPAGIKRLATAYIAKARKSLEDNGGDAIAIPVLEAFFKSRNADIQRAARDRREAQPSHLKLLATFAERAYRRPLQAAERADLLAFYRTLRGQGLDHEQALRDTVTSVLVSPHFLYRLDLDTRSRVGARGKPVRPLQAYALASRLSYFLWSSMPDAELLARAAAGDLHRPEVLSAQARRMLLDPKARALAVEFGGNWLDFRRFEEHNGVDRGRFPSFDNDLRQAMFEEPVRYLLDVAQSDRSVLDLLYGKHTFVNAPLARHYGMPAPTGAQPWARVDDADRYGRGGLLPMSVFLTKNAPGLRTSPVKRGYWLVRRVLGEQIPPPPAQVPDLPTDEAQMGELTLREVLTRHRQDKACAGCHNRFDSFGLAFEGYGPVGEARSRDLGGRPVDTHAAFPGGGEGTGVPGLRDWLREHRQDDFLDNLCRKLLSFALSRTLLLSDGPAVKQMLARLAGSGHRFSVLIDEIVTSPQFLNKRSGDMLAQGGN
jgi:hypothetical protein